MTKQVIIITNDYRATISYPVPICTWIEYSVH